jgi:hypothetical protein
MGHPRAHHDKPRYIREAFERFRCNEKFAPVWSYADLERKVKEELQCIPSSNPLIYQEEKQELQKLLDDALAFEIEMMQHNYRYMRVLKEGARKEMELEYRLAIYPPKAEIWDNSTIDNNSKPRSYNHSK